MARKFNNGRFGEQLMNSDVFEAYNRIKYIGNVDTPVQQYQTPIMDKSLWVNNQTGHDVMNIYRNKTWNPLFEGYYHPADLTVQPVNPVDGQVWINGNGQIFYYRDNQWNIVYAGLATDTSAIAAGAANFMILPNLTEDTTNLYTVPLVGIGKLFDSQKYILRENFGGSNMKLQYPINGAVKNGPLDWVHINPSFLYDTTKRFIKVLDKQDYIINVTTNNTEFYGFMSGSPVGTFLRHVETYEETDTVSDYRKVSGGIQLINNGKSFDYIYAITYKFDSVETSFGEMITGTATIGGNNDVFVGQINGFPLVFLNGMYLEQAEYTYDKNEGMLSFSGTGITNELDIVVAAFADIVRNEEQSDIAPTLRDPFEFTVTSANVNNEGNIVFQHEYAKQAANFAHPIAFVQGIGCLFDPTYGVSEDIDIDTATGTITVKNFGPMPEDQESSVLIADIGSAMLTAGDITATNEIKNDLIKADKTYLVFVNGICLGPSDLEITEGNIKITGTNGLSSDPGETNKYVLMVLATGDTGIDLMFDSSVSYFTTQIDDKQGSNVYNDCNMVVAYISKGDEFNGILVDLNHIEKSITGEEAYATGEILKVKDTDLSSGFTYEYKIYNANGDYAWTNYSDEFDDLDTMISMITQFNGKGSISIMSNEQIKGSTLEYYAYAYADETDEPILSNSLNCKIAVKNHMTDAGIPAVQENYVNRIHYYYPTNKGILGTYVNGVQVASEDIPSVDGKFAIDTPENINFIKTWGTQCDLYNLLKALDETTTLPELQSLKDNEFKVELAEYPMTIATLDKLKSLSAIIKEFETENELFYYVERIESNESYSVNRDWLTHGNRFDNFDNTYAAMSYIGPGFVDVYLNGVMLDRSSYSLFNNNHVMLNDLAVAGGSDEYDMDDEATHRLIKYYIEKRDEETGEIKGEVIRLHCETPDEVLVEYRPDTSLRKASYELKEITYDMNGVMPYEDYEFPASLLNTKDAIKIWIDGILYTGGYHIDGKDIVLENSPLRLDPIKEYFNANPDTYKQWKSEHGEYSYSRSRIIFEWR